MRYNGGMHRTRRDPIDRFLEKFTEDPKTGCWRWTAYIKPNGYAYFGLGREEGAVYAHRWAYEYFVGPIPSGMDLDHLCRVRHCVNPAHLEPVPRRTNLLRGKTAPAENVAKTHCPHGHEYSPENTYVDSVGSRHCKACRLERSRSDRAREYQRRYRKEHPEQERETRARYLERHPEEKQRAAERYRARYSTPEAKAERSARFKEYWREYSQRPEVIARKAAYHARPDVRERRNARRRKTQRPD